MSGLYVIYRRVKEFVVWKVMPVLPLEQDEIEKLKKFCPCMERSFKSISKSNRKQGVYYIDDDGEAVTSLVGVKNVFLLIREKEGMEMCYRKLSGGQNEFLQNPFPAICIRFVYRNTKV